MYYNQVNNTFKNPAHTNSNLDNERKRERDERL